MEKTKTLTVVFLKARKSLVVLEERNILIEKNKNKQTKKKTTEDGEKKKFLMPLISKLIKRAREQLGCLRSTFYQLDFMKRLQISKSIDVQFVKKNPPRE